MCALRPRAAAIGLAVFASLTACSHDVTSPTPSLASVAPDLVCNGPTVSGPGGVTTVALHGDDFTPMPSRTLTNNKQLLLPQVTLDPVAAIPGGMLASSPVDLADDPANPTSSRLHWTSESEMSFDVVPSDNLPTGVFDVTVTNPDKQRKSTLAQVLAVLPPPVVTSATPMAICDDQGDQTVVITGTDFLVYAGESPTVTIQTPSGAKTYMTTFQPSDCTAIPGTFTEQDAELCTAISFTIPQGDITVTANTMLSLVVTNPPPADCQSSTGFQVTLDVPPTVDGVVPSTVCQGGAQLTITGSGFLPGASVQLVCPGVTISAGTVTVNAGGTEISATFGGGAPAGDTCDVVVQNPDGCQDRPLPHKTVHVATGPIAFFVDPDVVYNGINTRITVYATTITWPVTVTLAMGGTMQALQTLPEDINHPNRVQAIVPAGTAPGSYDIILSDGLNCPTDMPSALTVTNTTTVTLKNVVPPFGQTGSDTAVEIFRDTAAVAPNDKPFVATPRVFLNPHNGAATDVAVALDSVAFLDMNRVTGVVPAATPAHVYDVVLVNPDGTVGLLDSGYTETTAAPPEIDSATPSSIVDQTGQVVKLAGTGFATGNAVSLACVDAMGNAEASPGVVSGAPSCTAGACTESVTIDGSALALGSVCVARLTNPDGTYGEYSAIGVTNSSRNLDAPKAGPDLVVGRRALAAGAGNATAADRFVYAIGGDSGMASGALDSVEYAPVDPFGTIGAFAVEPYALNTKRTLAGAVTVGRYMYLVGGNGGSGALTSAERAMILSPSESPQITDLDMQLVATGLDPGVYHYRVSAVFAANDPDNPGGESLASDELTVSVPSFPGKKIVVTLVWRAPVDSQGNALPNVAAYRIYRSAKDGAPGSEVLLATTAAATPRQFADDGTQTPGTATPLPLGATGMWTPLPSLGTAREAPGVAWARDPAAPGTFYVYALLGRSSPTTANASYEYLPVTIAANGHQTVGAAWTPGTLVSAQARWQLGAWTVDSTVSSAYTAPTSYVFLGGGLTAGGMQANKVEAGLVAAGGQLANPSVMNPTLLDDTPTDFSSSAAGYGVCAANDQLFSFGGLAAMPSAVAKSATLGTTPPALAAGAWNNEGLTMTHPRYLLGSTVQSAFIFLLGGQTDVDAASKTTELVIW